MRHLSKEAYRLRRTSPFEGDDSFSGAEFAVAEVVGLFSVSRFARVAFVSERFLLVVAMVGSRGIVIVSQDRCSPERTENPPDSLRMTTAER
jgi:hypothetical protein